MEKNLKGSKSSKKEKPTIKEFIQISILAFKLHIKISKVSTFGMIITEIIRHLSDIGSTYIFAHILDEAVNLATSAAPDPTQIIKSLGYAFVYGISVNLVSKLRNIFRTRLGIAFHRKTRQYTYEQLLYLGVQTIESPKTQKLLQTVNREIDSIRHYVRELTYLITVSVKFVVTALIMYNMSPLLFWGLIVVSIPKMITNKHFIQRDWATYKNHQDDLRKGGMYSWYLTDAKSIPEILLKQAEEFFDKKFQIIQKAFNKDMYRTNFLWNMYSYFSDILGEAVILYGYYSIYSEFVLGQITVGTASFYTNTMWKLNQSLADFSGQITQVYERATRYKEIYEFFNLQPLVKDGAKSIKLLKEAPSISINNLTFAYPGTETEVLKDLDLTIKPGEKIAIVGHNGAGKTTLTKLISKMYEIPTKTIFVDDNDITDVKTASWYQNLGVLFQEYNFYGPMTVAENIASGRSKEKPNRKRIIEAAKMADAHDFIMEYDNKYDTVMSEQFEDGIRPSTGQKQKIAIARFFYRNSPVVIFDEPTAAIDAVSEYKIFNRIYKFFENKTVIIISHRFSTVRNADRIIVMDQGRIIEEGSHDELMKKNGKYAEAFNLQAEGYQSDPQIEGKSTSDHE